MLTTPPEWFTVRADRPSLWSTDVRVNAEGVEQMARLWGSPITYPLMRYLWAAFLSSEAHFRQRLPDVQWGRFTAWQLIQFLHVGTGVAQGIAECTPDLPDLPPGAKARIYFHALLITSLRYACEAGVPSEIYDGEGDVPAIRWAVMKALSGAVCHAMGPTVAAELQRRGSDHVGYGAAQLELVRRAENLPSLFGATAAEAVSGLVRATKRRLYRTLRKRGLADSEITDFLEGLSGQAAITIANRWGDVDPLVLLGHALNGAIDVAPRAIHDDAAEAARPVQRRRELEVSFTPRRPRARADQLEHDADLDPPDLQTLSPEDEAGYRILLERLARDPKAMKLALAADAESQAAAAQALEVTDRTLRNWRKHVENLLRL